MFEIKFIRVMYKKEFVFEMKLQPDGSWSMREALKKKPKRKKKKSGHFNKLKRAYQRYLNR